MTEEEKKEEGRRAMMLAHYAGEVYPDAFTITLAFPRDSEVKPEGRQPDIRVIATPKTADEVRLVRMLLNILHGG